jgi:hypothetical protein
MSDFSLPAYDWRPRKDQMPIWRKITSPDFRRGNIVAHRRYGKDELALQALAVNAMSRVGSYWYCLPEYEQARKAVWTMVNWRTKRTRIDDAFPPEIVAKRDEQGMMLWLESGSTVQLIGSDRVDSLVGGGQIGIVMSEAALSNPKAMQFFRPILEESGGWEMQISTPRGKNHFYRAHMAAREDMANGDETVLAAYMPATKTDVFPVHQLHRIKMDLIREHGQVIGEAIYQQEYLCSFDAAVIGAVWGSELTDLEMEDRVRPCPHDKRFPVQTSWDIGIADPTAILFWQEINGQYRLIDAFEETSIGLDTYVQVLRDKHYEKGYNFAAHYGPHDIQQREWVRGVSRKDEAKRLGLEFIRTPNTRVKTQISAGAQLIRQMVVNSDNPGAMAALEKFKGWRYPTNKATGQFVETPLHDENSHSSSALCTFAINMASKLGMGGFVDSALNGTHADELGGHGKFDPRQYGSAPYSHAGSVSNMMRPGAPSRGAFG